MAEKQDIREEQMTVTNSVDYLRGLKGNNSVLISVLNAISNKFDFCRDFNLFCMS